MQRNLPNEEEIGILGIGKIIKAWKGKAPSRYDEWTAVVEKRVRQSVSRQSADRNGAPAGKHPQAGLILSSSYWYFSIATQLLSQGPLHVAPRHPDSLYFLMIQQP